jgi:probable F420-dependent oxidoreductase
MGHGAPSAAAAAISLGRLGIWSGGVRFAAGGAGIAAAVELERLGFSAVWVPGGIDSGVLGTLDQLLDATSTITLGTGILNIWKHEPAEVAAWWKGQTPARQKRVLLGLGVSHGPLIGDAYRHPLAKMQTFLDGLEAAGMPRGRLCLAALGPKMLQLAAARTAGAHPYLVSPRHTAYARKILGPDKLLAPEQGVILESTAAGAREIARETLVHYARLPNYVNNWLRDGFTPQDVDSLSDRLVDSLVAWGSLEAVADRVREHLSAGADHVCLQVISAGGMNVQLAEQMASLRELGKLCRAPFAR